MEKETHRIITVKSKQGLDWITVTFDLDDLLNRGEIRTEDSKGWPSVITLSERQ
jgi:hypothetical protein